MRPAAARAAGTTLLALLAVACVATPGPSVGTDPSPPVDTASPSRPGASATPSPTGAPASSRVPLPSGGVASPTPGGPSPVAGSVVEDASLLEILPAEVGGVAVVVEPEAFAEAASDPDFAANAQAAAFFVAVSTDDLASGVVARLRPGVYSEALFRDWRDTYDEGACAQAGGVAGNAQAELGGRTVHITSCAGGLLVYHAYFEELDTLVSLISLGEARLGEQLVAGIRP